MSQPEITPIKASFAPCPPGLPDAMYAAPEFNQQSILNEIGRVFRATKPVSTNSLGTPADGFGGTMQIAVDPALPIYLELATDPHTGASWVSTGALSAADFVSPSGRKAGFQASSDPNTFHWRSNLGYRISQMGDNGELVHIANMYVSPGGNAFGQNFASISVGNASSQFTENQHNQIIGLGSASFTGGVLAGQANNPGTITLSTGATIYLYLTINNDRTGVAQLAFSGASV